MYILETFCRISSIDVLPLEELFHVALADVVTDVADIHTCGRHDDFLMSNSRVKCSVVAN